VTSALESLSIELQARKALPPPETCRAIRMAASVSLARVGRICGVSAAAVYEWELGKSKPRGDHLISYLEVLEALKGVGPANDGPGPEAVDAGDGRVRE
jgi:DNA-binding transcriptional regulator YiaG